MLFICLEKRICRTGQDHPCAAVEDIARILRQRFQVLPAAPALRIQPLLKEIFLQIIFLAVLPLTVRHALSDMFSHPAHRLMELLRIHRLQDIIHHAVPERLAGICKVIVPAEYDDLHFRIILLYMSGQFQSVHIGHFHIRQKQVNMMRGKNAQRVLAIHRF